MRGDGGREIDKVDGKVKELAPAKALGKWVRGDRPGEPLTLDRREDAAED